VTTTIAPNPNPKLNAWCPRCEEWTLRTNRNECLFCDGRLREGPSERFVVEGRAGSRLAREAG
jgi:hypothetical protein